MTPTIRLLVSDIDGTLVRHDKSLSDENIAAAHLLNARGIRMALISARPINGIRWIAEKLELDGPCGAFNGGTLFDSSGVVGTPARLDPEVAGRHLSILDVAGVDVWVFAGDRWYVRKPDNAHVPREILSSGLRPIIEYDLAEICDCADKIVGISDDAPFLKQVETIALAAAKGRATVAMSQPHFLDATALTANKGDGLAAIAEAFGVPLEEVAVIGDMPNDLPMFARAGLSIAMGQAPSHVRGTADWITETNENDGVAAAIHRLLKELS